MGHLHLIPDTFENASLWAEAVDESTSRDPDDYRSDAEDEVCRDARLIGWWLDAEIAEPEFYAFQASTPACWIEFEKLPVGRLLVLAFDAGQPAETRTGAMDELRERFVKASADDVHEVAHRLAREA